MVLGNECFFILDVARVGSAYSDSRLSTALVIKWGLASHLGDGRATGIWAVPSKRMLVCEGRR